MMMTEKKLHLWKFFVFPGITMALAWGLRGFIGGGPFGAMIPGAMFALSLALLLGFKNNYAALVAVFSVVGIGIGGGMTYGQTIGFIRDVATIEWGLLGLTVKGAVWGVTGGTIIGLGLLYRRLGLRIIAMAFFFFFLGMLAGYLFINQPMIIYFSNPDSPRPESWAAFLMGAMAMLLYLTYRLKATELILILRFSFWGLIAGGIGFGVGGLWISAGSILFPDAIFQKWWKFMEFTFGFILGAGLGYAAWLNRKELVAESHKDDIIVYDKQAVLLMWQIGTALFAALLVYFVFPHLLAPMLRKAFAGDHVLVYTAGTTARVLLNFSMIGFLMILLAIKKPATAWQIAITLTFCHAVIDLVRDYYPDVSVFTPFTIRFMLIFLMTAVVAVLTIVFSRNKHAIRNLFLLLVWSCIAIALLRWTINLDNLRIAGLTFCEVVCNKFICDVCYVAFAVYMSWFGWKEYKQQDAGLINK